MFNRIRITVAALVIMAICTLSSTMTLSYFTDTQTSKNEFTVGNASTSLAVYDDISGSERQTFVASTYSPLVDREIPFYLQATNTGNIPVFQRFRVVIPKALASAITLILPNMNDCKVETAPEQKCENTNYTVTYSPNVSDTYAEYYITSNTELAIDGTTVEWPTASLKINGIADIDQSDFTCSDVSANNCKLWINVYSDTIQTTGFMNAEDAFINLAETY